MQLNIQGPGEVINYHGKVNQSRDGTLRYVDIEFGRDREQLASAIGEPLTNTVFAGYRQEEYVSDKGESFDGYWATNDLKFSKRVVPEMHRITIGGESFHGQPHVVRFAPVDNTEKIIMTVRIELSRTQTELMRTCDQALGGTLVVECIPSQTAIPLEDKERGQQLEIIHNGIEEEDDED